MFSKKSNKYNWETLVYVKIHLVKYLVYVLPIM